MKLDARLRGTPADKVILVACLVFLALALALYYGQAKAAANVGRLDKQVETAARDLRAAQGHPDLEETQQRLSLLLSQAVVYPTYNQAEEAMPSIWAWAQESGVALEQMAYNVTESVSGDLRYHLHSYPLTGKGTPASVAAFVKRMLESPLRTGAVNNLQVNQRSDGLWQFTVEYVVRSEPVPVAPRVSG